MDAQVLRLAGVLLLRSISVQLTLQGRHEEARVLNGIATLASAGRNVDAHMRKIADDMANGIEPDTDDLISRIEAESQALQEDVPEGTDTPVAGRNLI